MAGAFLKSILCFMILCFLNRASCEFERRKDEESIYRHTHKRSSLVPSTSCSTPSPKGPKGKASSTLKVVNRHGPCSHLDQRVPTVSEILSQDQHRVESIRARISVQARGKNAFTDSRKAKIPVKLGNSLGSGNYVVTVGLGTPKRDVSLVFDTGSDLTWTQCEPCARSCYVQQDPRFNPSLSATYSNITCTSPLCSDLSSATGNDPSCAGGSTCVYGIQYGDQSFSVGYFGKDKLTLSPTDTLDGFLFGCGQNNQGLFGKTAGLIGLGRDKLSVVSQSARKYGKFFSYCLPQSSSSTGYLTLGKSGISKNLKYTPFATGSESSFYYITVLDMYVGGTKLSISPSVFSNGGTIIDSGTVITRLPPDAYSVLSKAFDERMANYPKAPAVSILDTCYDFSNYTTISYPKVSWLFGGNVKVDLDFTGIFYIVESTKACLAFAGNGDPSDVGILGNVQQRNLQVVYDVAGGKLGFGANGCA